MKAPFPWFGGKSRVAPIVWDYFGDVRNYVEPFAGSLAVLLGRPTEPKIETVNDLDCWVANFWRALQGDPEQLAERADWPVNEADLHARHLWLVNQAEFRERMKTDPDYFDVKIAGWWVWGICQWIGSGWCAHPEWRGRHAIADRKKLRGVCGDIPDKRPLLTGHTGSVGVHKRSLSRQIPFLNRLGAGIHQKGTSQKRPRLGNDNGGGALNADVPDQMPSLGGGFGSGGCGIHANGVSRQIPHLSDHGPGSGVFSTRAESGLYEWFYALAGRLRRVRVCCGDWRRILGPAPTTCIGTTGVFLDPPYAVEERSDVYNEESRDVAHDVREWAIANGDNPELRIALCGYDAEDYRMPESWTEIAWKANGGYGNQANQETTGRANAGRERIWFSPYCLQPQAMLFQPEHSEASTDAHQPLQSARTEVCSKTKKEMGEVLEGISAR